MREFLLVLSIILRLEGGWNPNLDGGTNYGIRAATLSSANALRIVQTRDIRKLSRREAALTYYKMFWLESGAYRYAYPLDLVVFDAAVHMGPREAKKLLRTAMQKSSSKSARQVATQYVLERYKRLRSLRKFPKYKRGWRKRMQIIAGYVMASKT
jgi:lysozyme family protein